MIAIFFIDETLDNNEIFWNWIKKYKKLFCFYYSEPIILKDSEIMENDQSSINQLLKYYKNGYNCNVLYITCYYGNVKCIKELCKFDLQVYHYIPDFNSIDIKNIMINYSSEHFNCV